MKPLIDRALWLAFTATASVAATQDTQPPDREMLKMMELLRQMDMIKQMEVLRDMHHLENAAAQPKTPTPQPAAKKNEAVK